MDTGGLLVRHAQMNVFGTQRRALQVCDPFARQGQGERAHAFALFHVERDRRQESQLTERADLLRVRAGRRELQGLLERAITRDISWGVPLPPEAELAGGGEKRLYVWFEAVIGYLSASKEWAASTGDPAAWQRWWTNPDAETYYFIGKDNIPFHAVFWPSYLLGYNQTQGPLNLPTDVPANQYVTFKGDKASKSRGIGISDTSDGLIGVVCA